MSCWVGTDNGSYWMVRLDGLGGNGIARFPHCQKDMRDGL